MKNIESEQGKHLSDFKHCLKNKTKAWAERNQILYKPQLNSFLRQELIVLDPLLCIILAFLFPQFDYPARYF
jgi:hypothetical protein